MKLSDDRERRRTRLRFIGRKGIWTDFTLPSAVTSGSQRLRLKRLRNWSHYSMNNDTSGEQLGRRCKHNIDGLRSPSQRWTKKILSFSSFKERKSVKLKEEFLDLAKENTNKDLETCGILGAFLTHPSQSCFLSSIDLHTQYSYQVMLPEAIAIVMAPTDPKSTCGIFRLTNPGGINVLKECKESGFHPHPSTSDGSPIYESCSNIYENPNLRFEIIDLRSSS
ncbi:hypothetical protein MUK42_20968 [Musa troglodytarum]|uniref:JAB1/MPN/MOV34 metalloenzyme domain-containing protein n=1 Tax=Musa troglodytarum TaxID=320322 RepID=A0A9E7G0G7_9LILI|nr:hypothetical protein MUK42_20968 [Musa troglodytarum]